MTLYLVVVMPGGFLGRRIRLERSSVPYFTAISLVYGGLFLLVAVSQLRFPQPLSMAVVVYAGLGMLTLAKLFIDCLVWGAQSAASSSRTPVVRAVSLAILIPMFFALIYWMGGLQVETQGGLVYDGPIAIYFSLITWTTLGYGDVTPAANLRHVAAAEAVMGYVFMGMLVGFFVRWIPVTRRRA